MKKQVNINALFLVAILTMLGCTKSFIDDLGPDENVPDEVFYDPDVANIMLNNCTTCHGGPAPSAGLDLTTYSSVRFASESGNLINRINNAANPMPPSGLLLSVDREKIQKWASAGFPEN